MKFDRLNNWFPVHYAVVGLIGCSGSIDGPGLNDTAGEAPGDTVVPADPAAPPVQSPDNPGMVPTTPGVTCATPGQSKAPLRRLTNTEYAYALEDALGLGDMAQTIAGEFAEEPDSGGFRTSADALRINSPLLASQYGRGAEAAGKAFAATPDKWGCAETEATCANQLITSLGLRLYRRPLEAAEVTQYETLFGEAQTKYDFTSAVQLSLQTMLQSPHFLYRVEVGEAGPAGLRVPTQYEMASRLSFLLHRSVPSEELLGQAERGELSTPAQIETTARAMLQSPLAKRTTEFYAQWLDTDHLREIDRDPQIFADAPDRLGELLEQESDEFLKAVLDLENPTLGELFTAEYTYANKELADHYGLTGPTGEAFERVAAPGRAGVLTQGGLVSHDPPTRTSIVLRGLRLREALLCGSALVVPEGLDIPELEAVDDNVSQRERLRQHREDAACSGCHNLIDPLGIVFESFDAVGRTRTEDQKGFPIDTQTTLVGVGDVDGPVATVTDLGGRMALSQSVAECYVRQSFNYFFGRDIDAAVDACTTTQLNTRFSDSGNNLNELLIAFTQSDAFLYMPSQGNE